MPPEGSAATPHSYSRWSPGSAPLRHPLGGAAIRPHECPLSHQGDPPEMIRAPEVGRGQLWRPQEHAGVNVLATRSTQPSLRPSLSPCRTSAGVCPQQGFWAPRPRAGARGISVTGCQGLIKPGRAPEDMTGDKTDQVRGDKSAPGRAGTWAESRPARWALVYPTPATCLQHRGGGEPGWTLRAEAGSELKPHSQWEPSPGGDGLVSGPRGQSWSRMWPLH